MDSGDMVGQVGMVRRLSDDHWQKLISACSDIQDVAARTDLTCKGQPVSSSQLLLDGMMGRYMPGPKETSRQMVALQVPGDFVDLHSFPGKVLDHDVTSITDIRIGVFPHEALRALIEEDTELAMALWELTVIDAAIHRHWSFRMGALRALAAVANFLCEMELRLRLAGRAQDGQFRLPMTQIDIGEACGTTPVHVSRMLRDLREGGLCSLENGLVTIPDRDELRRVGRFDPQFLYLDPVADFDPD
ncbi:Crp/Fnr family transcriptional regulator [Jannaschia formosa]|uniref:Crp/Fnr family transcriptional regulator n=1 Tax=Jannaschia formosa TaxID=2259592 RepID=UPI001431BA73|nr:Crp/Fnr family transcriptional regulator [Jannaschia formosa]